MGKTGLRPFLCRPSLAGTPRADLRSAKFAPGKFVGPCLRCRRQKVRLLPPAQAAVAAKHTLESQPQVDARDVVATPEIADVPGHPGVGALGIPCGECLAQMPVGCG